MSLDPKKLVDAIKMFQKKIEKQGRVTNARDEEHLERLKKLYKDMGGKKKFEYVNEDKNNSENLNIEFGKIVQDFYNKSNQIADKINKLKGDKTDGKIVMKNVKKQVTPLIKLMHSWNKGQQKNPNLTTERKFNHKKSGDDYLGGSNSPKGDTEMFSDKKGRYYVWVKPKGGKSKYIDLPKDKGVNLTISVYKCEFYILTVRPVVHNPFYIIDVAYSLVVYFGNNKAYQVIPVHVPV